MANATYDFWRMVEINKVRDINAHLPFADPIALMDPPGPFDENRSRRSLPRKRGAS